MPASLLLFIKITHNATNKIIKQFHKFIVLEEQQVKCTNNNNEMIFCKMTIEFSPVAAAHLAVPSLTVDRALILKSPTCLSNGYFGCHTMLYEREALRDSSKCHKRGAKMILGTAVF